MNKEEIIELFHFYKRYYNKADYKLFVEIFEDEFSDIPTDLMKMALKKWLTSSKARYQPTIIELKELLWRIKMISVAKLFDSDLNEKWNEENYSTRVYAPDLSGLINETEDEKWIVNDKLKPVLTPEEKANLTNIVSVLNIGLRGFNEEYE